jgi:hypothetical protein
MVLHSLSRSRSYRRDSFGRSVLIGLTFDETEEFERLDASPAVGKDGHPFPWPTDGDSLPPSEHRWSELYEKHSAACRLLDQIRRHTSRIVTRRNEDDAAGGKSVAGKKSATKTAVKVKAKKSKR